ncbi:MAG: hypothetical protein R3185_06295 [Candidatus Thermoplasmatota archaeon]|nr:hypothetical protein [Candidatus Thermoplasmatota archaeon]
MGHLARTPFRLMATAILLTAGLAGCLGVSEPGAQAPVTPASTGGEEPAFWLAGSDCEEGGFVSAYPMTEEPETRADVWVLADIREEIGDPLHDARGIPRLGPFDGPLMANWHMGFNCERIISSVGEVEDYVFGFVGDVVEQPAWDPGGADLHYLLSGFGFSNDEGVLDAHLAANKASITEAVEATVDWHVDKELARSAASVRFVDAEKGVYEAQGTMAFLRDVPERTIRLWWQVPTDGSREHQGHHNQQNDILNDQVHEPPEGEWHPIYWDLQVSAARQYTTPPDDGVQWSAHNMLAFEHGALVAQPTVTAVYEYPELRLTQGQVIEDVTLDAMWIH